MSFARFGKRIARLRARFGAGARHKAEQIALRDRILAARPDLADEPEPPGPAPAWMPRPVPPAIAIYFDAD